MVFFRLLSIYVDLMEGLQKLFNKIAKQPQVSPEEHKALHFSVKYCPMKINFTVAIC